MLAVYFTPNTTQHYTHAMRLRLAGLLLFTILFTLYSTAQSFSFNCTRDTLVAGCSATPCFTLKAIVPDIHASSATYTVNPINCAPNYSSPGIPGTGTNLNADDTYSGVIPIGFPFPFYGDIYNNLVISTNGVVSFDASRANQFAHFGILNSGGALSATAGTPLNLPSTLYDRALIMGPYHDIDIAVNTSPNRRIQYTTVGTAPTRKWIVSFYQIPLFDADCNDLYQNTHQIVLDEATGIVEVLVQSKEICTDWNQGRGMIGLQNFAKTSAIMAPGRAASNAPWGSIGMNEAWRFVPSAGPQLFKRAELLSSTGTVLATNTTPNTLADGSLEVLFPNICPPAGSTTLYVIRSVYAKYDDPNVEVSGLDTIRVIKSSATDLNPTASHTPTSCGVSGTGTITAQVPAGVGTAPFEYSITSASTGFQSSPTFTNLNAGPYTVYVRDASGCFGSVPVMVTSTGTLDVTYNPVNTSCNGAPNGGLNVQTPNGTAPFTYTVIPEVPPNTPIVQANGNFTGLAAGNYFLSVQDVAGCEAMNLPFSIAPGPSITLTETVTATSCPGATNGSITITPTGTAPHQFAINGGPLQTSNTFTNLAPGTYFIDVRDAVGCTITFYPITVPQGNGTLTGTATGTATSCTGATNGSITVTPTTGSGPYQYSINNGTTWQASNIFSGLAAGNYNVIIREGGLCTSNNIPVTVAAGSALLATTATTATSCNGATDGTITVTPTNGAGPYQYTLDGGTPQAGNVFTNVAAGNHTIIVRDGAGCVSASIPVTVAAGSALTGTATSTATACAGVNNGTITATAAAAYTGPFEYSLDGGTYQAGNTFTNVSAGAHNVRIRNTAGCVSANIPVTVAAGTVLTATVTSSSTACVGVNNGSVTVTPTNGGAPYQYSLDGGANQASNVFTGVSAGNHTVVVTDAFGCISASLPVTVAAGTTLTGALVGTPTSCNGAADGTITANATNGSGPYQYALDGGAPQPSNLFTGVAAGNHTVIIRDNFGCISAAIPITVNAGPALTGTATSTSTACAGVNNGTITVTPAASYTGPFEFALDGGAYQAAAVFNGVSAGAHTVRIRNTAGCVSADIPVTVAAGTVLTATAANTSITCNGANDGTITITPTNGGAPYQYALDGNAPQLSNIFTGVTPGAHTVIVTDSYGCVSAAIPVNITQPAALNATRTVRNVSCNGDNDGLIRVTASGGTTPYRYSLDNITFQTPDSFGVAAGTYTVYVRDANNCVFTINGIAVTEPGVLTGTITGTTNSTCDGGDDGTITVVAAGGTAPYQYSANNTTFHSSNVLNVKSGTFNVYIRDANGCEYVIPDVQVGLTDNLTLTANAPGVVCEGKTVELIATSNATSYTWTPGASLTTTSSYHTFAAPTVPTTYTVTAILGACSATADVFVDILPAPVPDAGPDGAICFGQNYQLQAASGHTSYLWTPATYLDNPAIPNPQVINPAKTITYSLNVVGANGCSSLVADQVVVDVTPPIKITTSPVDTVVYAGAQFQLQASSVATSYVWTPASGLDNPNIANPVATAPGLDGQTITYQVVGTTAAGCRGEAYVTVRVYKGPDIYVANGFTPNGDGKNDLFIPFPVGIKSINYFQVYNRWGQLMFSTTTLLKGWDGKFSGMDQSSGVYVWMIQAVTQDNRVITKKGTVTLIR